MTELLGKYIEQVKNIKDLGELGKVNEGYSEQLKAIGCTADEKELICAIAGLAYQLVHSKEKLEKTSEKVSFLTEAEKKENLLVQQLLDENRFTYHFQPIIRVDNGKIFGYEALMRAGGMQGITPFHILKYAALADRLDEVEEYTFINILNYISENNELFEDKAVFINSMPSVHMLPEKEHEIERLLCERKTEVVVEMIESSEYEDSELDRIKGKFGSLNVPIAIDDYGTGYSNISNLLRYKPNFVKIDRALLSGIEDNPNKKHFVREIIDFCHDNDIMALAEGVESSDELRTVILLGADLIQGFYTARPSAEVIPGIPYALRDEIRVHRQEREDGRRMRIYSAEKDERILLDRLNKEGYSCIHIGFGYDGGKITVAGSPHSDSGVHLVLAEGFSGTIVLENARLSNLPERPCIDIGNSSHITLLLIGMNTLDNSGIRVPDSSTLLIDGQGSLDIRLGASDYYGIGNDLESAHGRIDLMQDGTISITAKSHAGVCIGSGLGGRINIGRGRYVLNASGSSNVGLGSCKGNTSIELLGCDFECTAKGAYNAVIGSLEGTADIHIIYSSVRCVSESQLAVGIGVLHGADSHIRAESVSLNVEMRADSLTALGSYSGASEIKIERSSVSIAAEGTGALALGSKKGNTKLRLTDIDFSAVLFTEQETCVVAAEEDVVIHGGRYKVEMGGKVLDRIVLPQNS